MVTRLGERNLWIQISCRPVEGWALPAYSCSRCATRIEPARPNQVARLKWRILFIALSNASGIYISQ